MWEHTSPLNGFVLVFRLCLSRREFASLIRPFADAETPAAALPSTAPPGNSDKSPGSAPSAIQSPAHTHASAHSTHPASGTPARTHPPGTRSRALAFRSPALPQVKLVAAAQLSACLWMPPACNRPLASDPSRKRKPRKPKRHFHSKLRQANQNPSGQRRQT